jgi:branched-chain amino acid transport system ATP-binding protein
MPETILRLDEVSASYGTVEVLHAVSLEVGRGETVTIIGSNGAGKTTLLKSICGLITKKTGAIDFEGRSISSKTPDRIVGLGVSLVPEGRQIFGPFAVAQNLHLGAFLRHRRVSKKTIQQSYDVVYGLFPILQKRKNQLARTLSGGEQQMLAIGRALMADPKLLLLDEPSMGLAPKLVGEIFSVLMGLVEKGLTIVLVEQNARVALEIAQRGFLLEMGRIALGGGSSELRRNELVKKIYLGEE